MQLKFAVAIPVYNHPNTVVDIIKDCLAACSYPIIVVDDGSQSSVHGLYKRSQPDNPRLHFITHSENQGKGAALLTATHFATAQGWTHLVTIDADGQHLPEDISKLTAAALRHPWSVILGDREMNTQNVPKSSVFGKAFSNFWVKYETDLKVSDSQSGFRIYPLFYLQTMSFRSRRYDFEVEVLTRMIWKGVEIISVPIQVKYFPNEKRVTHFHKIKDNLRLVVLNTILVTTSLLKRKDSAAKSAVAVALGVFVGCLPLYGLHGLIAVLISLAFRMNFIYIFAGTQISIPPMVPVLIFGAHFLSEQMTGHAPTGFFGLTRDWLVGIFSLAGLLAVLSGLIVFIIKKYQKPPEKKVVIQSGGGIGISILKFFLKTVGLRFVYFCLYFVVSFYYLFSFKSRKASAELAQVIDQNLNFFTRQKLLWSQLYTFAQVLVDRAYQKESKSKKFVITEVTGVESFKTTLSQKPGVIVLQSHFGGWEMSFNYFQHLETNKKISAVMYGSENSYQHTSVNSQTLSSEKLKIEYYNAQTNTVNRLKDSLDQGHIVGMMGDRPVGRSYELVPIKNKLCLIDTSALRMSLLCGVKVYAIFCIKIGTYNYEVAMHDLSLSAMEQAGLSKDEQIQQISLKYARSLENHLAAHPEQWFNFYPFWSVKLF